MASRRICTANGHVYNLVSNPPRTFGVCGIEYGSDLVQRADDHEATVRARMVEQVPPCSRSSSTIATTASSRSVDGRLPNDAVTDQLLGTVQDTRPV